MLPDAAFVNGRTASGRTLVVYGHVLGDRRDWRFVIDGEEATVQSDAVMRDGGTRHVYTDRGEVVFPHRIGSDDRTPRLDGERMVESVWSDDRAS